MAVMTTWVVGAALVLGILGVVGWCVSGRAVAPYGPGNDYDTEGNA